MNAFLIKRVNIIPPIQFKKSGGRESFAKL